MNLSCDYNWVISNTHHLCRVPKLDWKTLYLEIGVNSQFGYILV